MDTPTRRPWLVPSAALNRFDLPPALVAPPSQPRRRTRYGFRVGDLNLLVGMDTVSEVLDALPVYPLPHTPPWLQGLINLRGNLVPVFDLTTLLSLTADADRSRRLLVLDRGEAAVALPIDDLPRVADLSRLLSYPPPLPPPLGDHVGRAYASGGQIWLEFDHRGFFKALADKFGTGRPSA